MKIILTSMKSFAYLVFIIFISSLIFFSVIEAFPGLLDIVDLDKIRYYAQKRGNIVDDKLAYRPRKTNFTIEGVFKGDQFGIDPKLAADIKPSPIKYTASYEGGFRVNSSKQPYDMLILGDSFIDIGENDSSTFSEKMAENSGLATFNLGRAGYGPYQYEILLNEYLKLRPRYAVFCFFAGNDMRDVRNYDEFLSGKDYGIYLRRRNFLERYVVAVSDTFLALQTIFEQTIVPNIGALASETISLVVEDKGVKKKRGKIRDYIGAIKLDDAKIPMRFSYWNSKLSAEELIQQKEWQSLKSILRSIKGTTERHGIELIILYLPSKIQVYGQHYVANESGSGFLKRIHDQLKYERNTLDAFSNIIQELGLEYLDLHSYFRELSDQEKLLFYPFDTHWNLNGREMAAKYVVEAANLRNGVRHDRHNGANRKRPEEGGSGTMIISRFSTFPSN